VVQGFGVKGLGEDRSDADQVLGDQPAEISPRKLGWVLGFRVSGLGFRV